MPKPNEIDEFFDGLPSEDKKESIDDIFKDEPEEKKEAPVEGDEKAEDDKPEKDDEPRKNRRHRRLEQQLSSEREARIRAEALAEARLEVGNNRAANGDVDPRWIRMYGDTPESRQAWQLQQEIFNDYKTQTKEEALREVQEQQQEIQREQRAHEELIDSELEGLEDEFNVDLTSDAPAARKARREFLEMVEKASPKDEDGNVTSYADFAAVYEHYELKRAKGKDNKVVTDRQKEIASRSMNKSNGSKASEQTITPGFDGWRKDYNLD